MDKVFMVIARYQSNVSYGVDFASYLCGIYVTEEDATKRVKELEDIIRDCQNELKAGEKKPRRIESFIRSKYAVLLGFSIEPAFGDLWTVTFEIMEKPIGDITACILGGAAYAK